MDYYKNDDKLCHDYPRHRRLRGISYRVLSEADFVEPVTVEEFKQYAYIDFATDDTLIAKIVKQARQQTETYLQKSLGVKTIRMTALECPDNFHVHYGPVATDDRFTGDILKEGGFDISITYETDASLVNEDIKFAIMGQAFYIYQNRDRFKQDSSIVNVHDGFKEKLAPYRNVTWP